MVKFLYFTDTHVRISSPRSRRDDFVETILKKLEYVAELGRREDVDAFICGGDWLDRPDIPYSMLGRFMKVVRRFDKRIFTVLGNHEEYGYNPDTHNRTALVALTAPDILTRLSMSPMLIHKGNTSVQLTGVDAHSLMDKGDRISDYTDIPNADKDELVKIHVVHGYLKNGPQWEKIPSTNIADITHTGADIVLSGHEHAGFGVQTAGNGKIFCNPGALARVSASVGDVNREVKVALITVNGLERDIKLIKLPPNIARPANEVIDWEKLEEEKRQKRLMMEFTLYARDTIEKANFGFHKKFDVHKTLEEFLSSQDVSEDVKMIVREAIIEAQIGSVKEGAN